MLEARPSRTAMRVAMRRAAHQVFDHPPFVLDDPHAIAIIGPEAEARMRAEQGRSAIARVGRAMMVVRSRFAEDALARAMRSGVEQYVVLGAGLDTFAYRNPFPAGALRVFEVDHPATQAWKHQKLHRAGIPAPADLTYVSVDFERQQLPTMLAQAGFDPDAPAFFSWLGVTMYLTDAAIATTLAYIASLPKGSGVALDYSLPASSLHLPERIIRWLIARKVKKVGEPFVSFFTEQRMRATLEQAGFRRFDDAGTEVLNERYFKARPDGLRLSGHSLRVVHAEV